VVRRCERSTLQRKKKKLEYPNPLFTKILSALLRHSTTTTTATTTIITARYLNARGGFDVPKFSRLQRLYERVVPQVLTVDAGVKPTHVQSGVSKSQESTHVSESFVCAKGGLMTRFSLTVWSSRLNSTVDGLVLRRQNKRAPLLKYPLKYSTSNDN